MYARTRYPSRTLSVYSYINKQNSLFIKKKKNKKQNKPLSVIPLYEYMVYSMDWSKKM